MIQQKQKNMSLLAIFAEVLPKEQIISDLKSAIEEYQINPSDENEKKVTMYCALLVHKDVMKYNGGMEKTMREMEQNKRMDTAAQ
jgi:hypothetical protein